MPITRAGWLPAARLYRPIHWRLFALAGMFTSAGAGFVLGWELVRRNGTRSSPMELPAPGWLPVAGALLIAAGVLALMLITLAAPVSTGERLPEHLRRPIDDRVWPIFTALLVPFDAAMLVSSIASTSSDDRWEPTIIAVVVTVLVPPLGAFTIRHQRWLWGSSPHR